MTPPPAATAAPPLAGSRRLGNRGAPRIPRRVSGPARRASARAGGIALPRSIDLQLPRPSLRGLSGALPRVGALLHGRGLIVVLATALLGLVFLQVSLLKLNTQITQNVERAQALERGNATSRATISELDAGRRIENSAGQLGMVMPGAGAVCYLDARRSGACSGGDPAAASSAVDPATDTAPPPVQDAATQDAATPSLTPAPTPVTADPVATDPAPVVQPAPAPAPTPAPEQQPAAAVPADPGTGATGGTAAGAGA